MQRLRPIGSLCKHSSYRGFACDASLAAPTSEKRSRRKLGRARETPGHARRAPSSQPPPNGSSPPSPGKNEQVAHALQLASGDNSNNLLAPVHIPEDQHGVLRSSHPASSILANSSIVVQRQLEMMNVMLGFEQANRYILMDSTGNHIGYLAEQEHGLGNTIARQTFRTHRSFTTHVFDKHEKEVLRFHRPFSWISSKIKVFDAVSLRDDSYSTSTALKNTSAGAIDNQTSASVSNLALSDMRIIGEAQQQWAPLRRKYNLFLHRSLSGPNLDSETPQLKPPNTPQPDSKALQISDSDVEGFGFTQFAYVNEPFLSWDFSLLSEQNQLIGSVNRNFAGFAREIFTDTGVYALRMDSAGLAAEPSHLISKTGQHAASSTSETNTTTAMTLDQRAVMLATAVSIDFDYFSRHSGAGASGGWMPLWFPWGGGAGEAAGAEAGAEAGAASGGTVEGAAGETGLSEAERAARGAQEAARGYGSGEGAIAGAGTMAGYEAMQRGREQNTSTQEQQQQQSPPPQQQSDQQDDSDDWWGGGSSGGSDGDGGDSGGDGGGLDLDDFF